jgi:UDP-GlcNAc3NAcA epimerase
VHAMRVITIVGARPQFVKAAAVCRAIAAHNATHKSECDQIEEVLVHTGQHFDTNMSEVFFDQLGIPAPAFHLGISGMGHGAMTGRMIEQIEQVLVDVQPRWVVLYGDTTSTLAGALAAVKLEVPIAHVEAGLRSFNPKMPEEVNRVLTDRISSLLLCPTDTSANNLAREGFPFPITSGGTQRVEVIGDVMLDAVLHAKEAASRRIDLSHWNVKDHTYVLCTLHRQENTDSPLRLQGILKALQEIATELPVVLPLHPRTRQRIGQLNERWLDGLRLVEPLPYLEMQRLLMSAKCVLTDSGGLQKEAFFHGVPCITMREETEWTETIEEGWNQVVGTESRRIVDAFKDLRPPTSKPSAVFGAGRASELVVTHLMNCRLG